jgi:hypothetical protein
MMQGFEDPDNYFSTIAQQVTAKNPLYLSLTAVVAQSKNRPFAVNTAIELKNITTASDSNGIWWGCVLTK